MGCNVIKDIPVIDINTGKIIRKRKRINKPDKDLHIDLREFPKHYIELEFNFDYCFYDREGYFGAEGEGEIKVFVPEVVRYVVVASFQCELSAEHGTVDIFKIKKKIPKVTGLQWLQKEWNDNNEVEVLGRECDFFVSQGYWNTASDLEGKYVG